MAGFAGEGEGGRFGAAGEADVDGVVVGEAGDLDQVGFAGPGQELDQALALLGAEAVADRSAQVVGVGVLGERGLVVEEAGFPVGARELLGVLEAVGASLLQGSDVGGRQQAGAGGPKREHEGQAGGRLPEVAEVVHARARETERGVADDQRGVVATHAGEALAVWGRDEGRVDAAGR